MPPLSLPPLAPLCLSLFPPRALLSSRHNHAWRRSVLRAPRSCGPPRFLRPFSPIPFLFSLTDPGSLSVAPVFLPPHSTEAMSSAAAAPTLLRVLGVAQQYEWGKLGATSAVAQLMQGQAANRQAEAASSSSSSSSPAFTLDAATPYAELWLGTHPSGPSRVTLPSGEQVPLLAHLGAPLPFLFKVLSVAKALSIQAHPDAGLAARLHAERPGVYKDPHHKPELACALTPFEAMCAFRPLAQIAQHAQEWPEMREMISAETFAKLQQRSQGRAITDAHNSADDKAVLRAVFTEMMTADPAKFQPAIEKMIERLKTQGIKPSVPPSEQSAAESAAANGAASSSSIREVAIAPLILRLAAAFPGDVGLFAPLLLNCLELNPGAALFLGPNEPHAYLSGDCVECMAGSDNVVRAGLTPKLRDTETLVSMLTYESHTAAEAVMVSKALSPQMREFSPPSQFSEFRLVRAEIKGAGAEELPAVASPSLLLVFEGEGAATISGSASSTSLRGGDVLLIPAGSAVKLQSKAGLLVFQCTANQS